MVFEGYCDSLAWFFGYTQRILHQEEEDSVAVAAAVVVPDEVVAGLVTAVAIADWMIDLATR